MNLAGKIAFITGSSRGIGRELAKQFLQRGAHVIIHGRDKNRLQEARAQLSVISQHIDSVHADLTVATQQHKIIAYIKSSYKKIDILIHNAAVSMRGSFENCTDGLLNTVLTTNLMAPLLLTRSLIPLLQEYGTIMFVSSGAGLYGFPHTLPYSVSKMGLSALQQGLDIELLDRKLHIGIAYLDFVKNDAEKTVLNERNIKFKFNRPGRLTQEHAAHTILLAIVHRHRTCYVGRGARLVAIMARYFPHLFRRLLIIRKHAIHEPHAKERSTA